MVNNIGSSRTILSYDSLKASIAKLETDIANRSFSLLKRKIYGTKTSVNSDEIFRLLRTKKQLNQKVRVLCKKYKVNVPPTFTHQENCDL